MSKICLFLFLGVCVVAVHMAPSGTADDAAKNREKVAEYGRKVEAKVRRTNKNFKWDQWWPEAQPVLVVIAEIVPANDQNKDSICNDDDKELLRNAYNIERAVKAKGITNFQFRTWYKTAKPVLKAIGDIALQKEISEYCPEKLND